MNDVTPVPNVDDLVQKESAAYPQMVRQLHATLPQEDPLLSVVVPAFNEERRILGTMFSMLDYFERRELSYEVIVVDDGSVDRTAELVRMLARHFHGIRLVRLPHNMGKGAAVRAGMRTATGRFVLLNDADGASPIAEVERLLDAVAQGADIAIGSRAVHAEDTQVKRSLKRFLIGRVYAFLVNAWAVPGIADTQCGFKLFRREVARHIFAVQRLDGFAFDIEVLRLAMVLRYRVAEIPINWKDVTGSKVQVIRDSLKMLQDLIKIRYMVPSSNHAAAFAESAGVSSRP